MVSVSKQFIVGRLFIIVYFIVSFFNAGQANAQKLEELDGLSLEELLKIRVETASKRDESLSDAPGVVTVISARDIEYFGGNNLMEVLERAPGFFGLWSQLFPQNGFAVRGDFPNHVSAHVLLLIDGRPVRESILGGFNLGVWTTFPLDAIERIEVVRGPGSVLYGTNAFTGVVNIITKKELSHAADVSVGGGSWGTSMATASGGVKKGKFSVVANARYFEEDGWDWGAFVAPGVWRETQYGEKLHALNVVASYGDFSLNVFWAGNTQQTQTPMPSAIEGDYESTRLFFDLGYDFSFSQVWTATANLTYNLMDDVFTGVAGTDQIPVSKDTVVEFTNYVSPNERLNLLFGASANLQSGEYGVGEGYAILPYDSTWWNAYFQVDYQVKKRLKLIAGGQFNKPENVDLDFVPRLGAIVNFSDAWGAKLLYGEAFRSGFAGETRFVIPTVLKGNPDLVPESVKTIDLQLFHESTKTQLALTFFKSKQSNLITRIPSPDPNFQLEFANQGELDTQGVEFEMKYIPTEKLYFVGSVAHQESENDKEIDNPAHTPDTSVKIGATFLPTSGVSIGVFNSYFSKPSDVSVVNPGVAEVNPSPEAYNFLSANIRVDFSKLLDLASLPFGIRWDIYGTNLLDEDVYYPEMVFRQINSVPGRGGRAVYSSVTLTF